MIVGSRGSTLALAQTGVVTSALGGHIDVKIIKTAGDGSPKPIRELEDGAFVAAIERALQRGEIDLAVHSLKDLPTTLTEVLVIAAIPKREDPRDAIVTRSRGGLADLPRGAVVGTSSPRRVAFLRALRPDVVAREIRGNVDTRLRRVEDGEFDAVILAMAGLRRLGITVSEQEALDPHDFLPAPGQGALAVQVRADDRSLRTRVSHALDDDETRRAVTAERALLALLGASCDLALGAYGRIEGDEIVLDAAFEREGGLARATVRAADPEECARLAAALLGSPVHAR
jgi:hydroxymethylbilane synthase